MRLSFLGPTRLNALPNIGKRSVRKLEAFVAALRRGDRSAAARWRPLGPDTKGPDLAFALEIVADQLTDSERTMLQPRLVEKRTLEECAEPNGVTRERIRQVEAAFIAEIARRLEWFSVEREEMLGRWVTGDEDFAMPACGRNSESKDLIKGALEALFRDTPQSVARELAIESALDEAVVRLEDDPDFWFGGTDIERFAAAHVPTVLREAFAERVAKSRRFRIDHNNGRVHPRRAGLFRAVTAILADEDEPIPLSWLLRLLRETGYFPRMERIDLLRRRSSWRKRDPETDLRILWRQ